MSIIGQTLALASKSMVGVSVNVMGYLGMGFESFHLGPTGNGFGCCFQELFLRTVSGNIYQIRMFPGFEEEIDVVANSPIALVNGRKNVGAGNNPAMIVINDPQRKDLVVELGESFKWRGGNASGIIEIVAVYTKGAYPGFERIVQGQTNLIRKEFFELLYPGRADEFINPQH